MSEWTRTYRHQKDDHSVVVSETDGMLRATVDGRAVVAEYEWVSPGVLHLRVGGRHVFCHVSARGEERYVTVGGTTYLLTAPSEKRGARGSARAEEGGLAAPMPGRVLKLSVEVGQEVEQGESLLILEAMKMEHEIRAPHAGTVSRIACKQGEMVQPGVPLLEIAKREEA